MLNNLIFFLYDDNALQTIRVIKVKSKILATVDRVNTKINKVKTDIAELKIDVAEIKTKIKLLRECQDCFKN